MLAKSDEGLLRYLQGRLMGLRNNRYSWWVHWRELADYFLPRRYKWIITPNQMGRGSPINNHILDSTGCLAARNLAAGLMTGKTPPNRPWLKLRVGYIDSTQTSPSSLWLAECERLINLVFHESNFYNCMATFYFDLVIFGTATLLIYEDFDNVIQCYNPCAGEYYVDIDGKYRPTIFYREFTMTVSAVVDEFGLENCSANVRRLYEQPDGSGLSREIIVAHAIEPNDPKTARRFGLDEKFAFYEAYWEFGGTTGAQEANDKAILRKRGFYEQPNIAVRWDLVSNDAYGRSPSMDALGDQKQLQLETRRKAQAIDKMVNPPLVADIQLKNQPASLLPGAITFVTGYASTGKPALSSVYDTKFPVNEIREDLAEVRERIRRTFFNDLFQTASQFETRSNITAVEWDMRKSESMVMLGPVLERIDNEGLAPIVERVFGIMSRAGILPPAPQEIADKPMNVEFVSMLSVAQNAAQATGIERTLALAGNLGAVDPQAYDNINIDMALDIYSRLMNNDPRMIRSPDDLARIRQQRQEAAQRQEQAELVEKMAQGAKTLADTDMGAGQTALKMITGTP